jgi:Na+-driven multidrug efflux pump
MEYPLARQHHVVSHVAAQTILMVVLVSVFLSVAGSLSSIAFSAATATVVGQNIGAGKLERARRAAHLAGWAAFLGLTALGLLFWPSAHATARLLVPQSQRKRRGPQGRRWR